MYLCISSTVDLPPPSYEEIRAGILPPTRVPCVGRNNNDLHIGTTQHSSQETHNENTDRWNPMPNTTESISPASSTFIVCRSCGANAQVQFSSAVNATDPNVPIVQIVGFNTETKRQFSLETNTSHPNFVNSLPHRSHTTYLGNTPTPQHLAPSQCNVAVHYNVDHDTVHTQPDVIVEGVNPTVGTYSIIK